ncbi:hypothetical protein EJB05_23824, partial [Eragrostis curvula]
MPVAVALPPPVVAMAAPAPAATHEGAKILEVAFFGQYHSEIGGCKDYHAKIPFFPPFFG